MCGITGAVWTQGATPLEPETLHRMIQVLTHRGPDDQGSYTGHAARGAEAAAVRVALGHRRLSIIDRAGGHQPLANEDGTIWVVFNGEIYNFRELRRRLEGGGHHFRTASDTEVLVHLYEDEGPGFLRHLDGMFAFALWDGRQGQLLLARDRLGKKPLVYREEPGRLLFASELKSLLEVPGVPREIAPHALDAYLTYQYVPHPHTIYRGISKLPPGCYAIFADGRLHVDCYWRPDFRRESRVSDADLAAAVRDGVTAAVRARLEAEVPLGAFLSGGIDSSIVVALMQEQMAEPVRTFSIGFDVPEYDETSYAREVAAHLGTRHEEFRVSPQALEILPRLVWHYDEPFADSSAIPTWYVSELTRQHVTVALTGDGGDELFAGYPRYQAVRLGAWFDRLPSGLRRMAAHPLWQRLPASPRQKSWRRRLKRLLGAMAEPPVARYLEWIAIFGEARRAALYSDDFLDQLPDDDPAEFLSDAFRRAGGRDAVTQASLADLLTYLPCDLMTKVDTASMAHSLECRQPLLDHHLVELAASLPVRMKLRGRHGKQVLRRVFGARLPAAVLRRPKMGFGVPLDHWFRHELRDFTREVLLDPQTLDRGYFRPEAVRALVDEHQTGHFDHAYRLWALLVLELWQRAWIG